MRIELPYRPRAWQKRCHVERKRFTVLALHRRAGKTFLGVMELVNAALRFTKELGGFFYVAPELKQARNIAWKRLKAQVEPLRLVGGVEIREAELTVTFVHNGATISLYGADNPDAMRGVRMDGVVIDEVAEIKPEVWGDIIQPALSDRLGWALFIGTPHGMNLFSELFFRAPTLPDWFAARFTVYDTDAIEAAEVSRLRAEMSETSFAREYLCDFTAAGDDQLVSLSDAEDASRRTILPRDVVEAPIILGVDPARFGDDRSVIFRRQGLQAFPPISLRGVDNMALAARVAAEIEAVQPHAVFIDSGAGAGVIDRLRQLRHQVVEVPFGGTALKPEQFKNRRTEMWWEMREWLRAGGAIPNDPLLKQELATPTYWFDANGRKVLESKDEIKKRLQGGGSPDLADALALTFASPVRKLTPLEEARKSQPRKAYSPFDRM